MKTSDFYKQAVGLNSVHLSVLVCKWKGGGEAGGRREGEEAKTQGWLYGQSNNTPKTKTKKEVTKPQG